MNHAATLAVLGRMPDAAAENRAMSEIAVELYGLDQTFRHATRALRVLLHIDDGRWPGVLARALIDCSTDPRRVDAAAKSALHEAALSHAKIVRLARFGPDHVASARSLAEEVAAAHAQPVGILAAFSRVLDHFTHLIMIDDRMSDRLVRRDAQRSLGTWLMLDAGLVTHFATRSRSQPSEPRLTGSD